MLVTRSLSKDMDPVPMQLHTSLFGFIICISGMIFGQLYNVEQLIYIRPGGIYWIWLFGVGLFATIARMMMTVALRFAPSATLAPLHYLEIVMSGLFGYWVFSDLPNGLSLHGMMIIIMSGVYIFIREQKLNKAKQL